MISKSELSLRDRVSSRITVPVLMLLFTVLSAEASRAQYITLSLDVDSEIVAEMMQPLSFGQVVPNMGSIRIPLGDSEMGVFSVSGPRDMVVELNLDLPEYLEFSNGNGDFRIPVDLEVSMANRNENNIDHAEPLPDPNIRFSIYEDSDEQQVTDRTAATATAYIYVYGLIEVGDIPAGSYDADVFLTVEYE